MKRLFLGGLSVWLMLGTLTPAVRSQTEAINPPAQGNPPSYISQFTPSNLVGQAYRGYFKSQGIPSYGAFLTAYLNGRITAKDLVKSAIESNKLPTQILGNKDYLNAVDTELRGLTSTLRS
jgi:hypothetical protein